MSLEALAVVIYDTVAGFVVAAWRLLVAFSVSHNFLGALLGVLLAFWIERRRTERRAVSTYGNVLLSARFELLYLRPMCVFVRDKFRAGDTGIRQSFVVPAVKAALLNPLVHERSPNALVMTLTILNTLADDTDESFREGAERLEAVALSKQPAVVEVRQMLMQRLALRADQLQDLIGLAIEQIDAELKRVKVVVPPESEATQEVRRRVNEILDRKNVS